MHRKVVINALTLALAVAASADPRNKITYQGALRDAGAPFDGTVDLLFRIYDAETDGSIIVPFLFQQVQVVDGRFTVELDFSSQAADLSEPTWIEIAVSTDSSIFTTLTPRQP